MRLGSLGQREEQLFPQICIVCCHLGLQNNPKFYQAALMEKSSFTPTVLSLTSFVSSYCPLLLLCLCSRHYCIKSLFYLHYQKEIKIQTDSFSALYSFVH